MYMQRVLVKVVTILMQSTGQLRGPVIVVFFLFQLFVMVFAAFSVEPLVTEEESVKLGPVVGVVLLTTQLTQQLR